LSDGTPDTSPTLIYDSITTTGSLGDWTTYFVNADTVNCDITSCVLKAQGCLTAYSPGNLVIAGSMPFAITATKNIPAGWSETVCVECTNAQDIQQLDSYVVT
jgi:hypothetical protein